ncbi:hypothetical protein PC129_g16456 [Phytophthora cactorum]|nr:hypothetical protein Pcac1_g21596 [Phytophthora cactorum]KAG2808320.1 hypothetical protein PC111_g16541 [Phytophthora cactorum]KAG2811759.1 hypothetical protein PC112_g15468 [Phytophthora cactorum]KAG2908892.1 hypothetical protein PC114_g10271 [Phytophthora cactorum]KAG2939516.1 hypothetical protein PC117_g10916 [Phytophthora cactorum]
MYDFSYPESALINGCTDQDSITQPDYIHCDAVATAILRLKRAHPSAKVCVMAGDVASAFRNLCIHSNSVYLFAGQIEEDDVIVIELSAPSAGPDRLVSTRSPAAPSCTCMEPTPTPCDQMGSSTITGSMTATT